jgi:fatty-acyl-CoA synthase
VVCLLMTNRPEYLAMLAGHHERGRGRFIAQHQSGWFLACHCIRIVSPKHIIVSAEFVDALDRGLAAA